RLTEGLHVAVDGPDRHLEPLGQFLGPDQLPRLEGDQDGRQSIAFGHGLPVIPPLARGPGDRRAGWWSNRVVPERSREGRPGREARARPRRSEGRSTSPAAHSVEEG